MTSDETRRRNIIAIAAIVVPTIILLAGLAIAVGEQKNEILQNIKDDELQAAQIAQLQAELSVTKQSLAAIQTDLQYVRSTLDENRADIKELIRQG
jgi:hypothetical protein